jgi:hypothetical protein
MQSLPVWRYITKLSPKKKTTKLSVLVQAPATSFFSATAASYLTTNLIIESGQATDESQLKLINYPKFVW